MGFRGSLIQNGFRLYKMGKVQGNVVSKTLVAYADMYDEPIIVSLRQLKQNLQPRIKSAVKFSIDSCFVRESSGIIWARRSMLGRLKDHIEVIPCVGCYISENGEIFVRGEVFYECEEELLTYICSITNVQSQQCHSLYEALQQSLNEVYNYIDLILLPAIDSNAYISSF